MRVKWTVADKVKWLLWPTVGLFEKRKKLGMSFSMPTYYVNSEQGEIKNEDHAKNTTKSNSEEFLDSLLPEEIKLLQKEFKKRCTNCKHLVLFHRDSDMCDCLIDTCSCVNFFG